MKYAVIGALTISLVACSQEKQQKAELKTRQDSVSYSIGHNIGRNLRQQSLELNADAVAAGLREYLSDSTSRLSENQIEAVLGSFQQELMAKHETARKGQSEKNLTDSQAFLEENKKEKGIVVLPSGLQYKVLKEGTGKKPKEDQTVEVIYRGTFIDGTEFDSSERQGGPATFSLEGIIKGWGEALQLMPVGSKWRIFIPPHLAYGEQGASDLIPPNAMLIFEVELVSIK